jgi:hypothetical protein
MADKNICGEDDCVLSYGHNAHIAHGFPGDSFLPEGPNTESLAEPLWLLVAAVLLAGVIAWRILARRNSRASTL